MGLDMYLSGTDEKGRTVELGYWRKHPNLHGYIVNKFAGGADECQDIPLTVENLVDILRATVEGDLPETQGFFFGVSSPDKDEETKAIIPQAIVWLNENNKRHVTYYASW
jgi:hypothetical protein